MVNSAGEMIFAFDGGKTRGVVPLQIGKMRFCPGEPSIHGDFSPCTKQTDVAASSLMTGFWYDGQWVLVGKSGTVWLGEGATTLIPLQTVPIADFFFVEGIPPSSSTNSENSETMPSPEESAILNVIGMITFMSIVILVVLLGFAYMKRSDKDVLSVRKKGDSQMRKFCSSYTDSSSEGRFSRSVGKTKTGRRK